MLAQNTLTAMPPSVRTTSSLPQPETVAVANAVVAPSLYSSTRSIDDASEPRDVICRSVTSTSSFCARNCRRKIESLSVPPSIWRERVGVESRVTNRSPWFTSVNVFEGTVVTRMLHGPSEQTPFVWMFWRSAPSVAFSAPTYASPFGNPIWNTFPVKLEAMSAWTSKMTDVSLFNEGASADRVIEG
jgi:hypothetical protein